MGLLDCLINFGVVCASKPASTTEEVNASDKPASTLKGVNASVPNEESTASSNRQTNEAAHASSDFVDRLYERLAATSPNNNLFLSPFSIQVALAMCAVGARGETRKVLADLIGAPESVDEQNQWYARLMASVNYNGRHCELVTANALWGRQGYEINPEYLKAIADYYGGAFNMVDFVNFPDEAVRTINRWVSNKTCGKINELINRTFIDAATCLILTNAIYFKGQWDKRFNEADTRDEDWFGPHGTSTIPTMHRTGGYWYCGNGEFQALDLPYVREKLSLLVVLPRKNDGLDSLEARWAAQVMYQRVTAELVFATVAVSLPRFKVEAELDLKPVLSNMGAARAFGEDADFSGIGKGPLWISEVIHKAYVDVNEEGTEAAAATAVGMPLCIGSHKPNPPIVFKADHPFLFFIRDRKTNTVLFSGRLMEPQ